MSHDIAIPYEGDRPYLFVSYCHKDDSIVLPVLRFLQDEGVRLWYDTGIDPGAEWPEVIADHIDQSSIFLAFISPQSQESHNCRKEFNFALMKNMPSLSVILEPMQFTPVMKLQMASVQALYFYEYGLQEFLHKLLKMPVLSLCRDAKRMVEKAETDRSQSDEKTEAVLGGASDTPLQSDSREAPAVNEGKETVGGPEDPGPPEPEKDAGTGVPGSGKKRKLIFAGVCAAAILVAVVVAAALRGRNSPVQEAGPTDAQSADVTMEPSQEPDSEPDHALMHHITLTWNNKVTVREFNEALSILAERLEVFTGGEPYEMTVEDNFINLYLPRDAFGETTVETAMKCYITRAMDLYIFDTTDAKAGTYLSMKKEPLSRSDLENVAIMEGVPDGVDVADYGIDTSACRYIAVTLTDRCAQQYSEEIAEWGENLAFGQDIDSAPTDYYYHLTIPAGDGKTFYILKEDNGGYFAELLLCSLTHDPLPFSFGITIDLSNSVDWQSPEDASLAGENQCEALAFTGDTVTFLLRHYGNNLTAGELLDLELEMKSRLDLLEQPYAYGLVENPNYYIIAVMTGLEHMGEPVMELIANTTDPHLKTNFVEMTAGCESFSWEKDADETYCVTLKATSLYSKELTKMSGWMAEQGGGTLYLANESGSAPLLSAEIDRQIEDGTVTFRHLCYDSGGDRTSITEENIWLLRLMDRVWNNSRSSITSLSVGDVQMNLEGKVTVPDKNRYGISYYQEEKNITDAILSVVPDAVVKIENYEVRMALDLEVNEDLPETAAATAQNIFEASGFEASNYRHMDIYLIDEEGTERGRIFFYKYYRPVSWIESIDVTDGYIYVWGIFMNGRLERYKEAFKNIVETDPFYAELTIEGDTHWTFDS